MIAKVTRGYYRQKKSIKKWIRYFWGTPRHEGQKVPVTALESLNPCIATGTLGPDRGGLDRLLGGVLLDLDRIGHKSGPLVANSIEAA